VTDNIIDRKDVVKYKLWRMVLKYIKYTLRPKRRDYEKELERLAEDVLSLSDKINKGGR